jgi:hypothetical protein
MHKSTQKSSTEIILEIRRDINKTLWILLLLWLILPALIVLMPARSLTIFGIKFVIPILTLILILSVLFSISLGMLMIIQIKYEKNLLFKSINEFFGFITIVSALLYLVFGMMRNAIFLENILGNICFCFLLLDAIMLKFGFPN